MRHHKKDHPIITPDVDEETADLQTSKTQMKCAMHALQSLGEQLITLKKDELTALALPERLFDAIMEAKRITDWGAVKRQKQYIGKLMRDVDANTIQAHLDTLHGTSQVHNAWFHRLEKIRDSLLADDQALAALLCEYPTIQVQSLRICIRNARKERSEHRPPKYFRALFQMLKEMMPAPSIQSTTGEEQ